jgi:hypothetical protein
VENVDFEDLATKYIGIVVNNAINAYKGNYSPFIVPKYKLMILLLELGAGNPFVDVSTKIDKCSKDCAIQKLQNLNCLQKQKSVVRHISKNCHFC